MSRIPDGEAARPVADNNGPSIWTTSNDSPLLRARRGRSRSLQRSAFFGAPSCPLTPDANLACPVPGREGRWGRQNAPIRNCCTQRRLSRMPHCGWTWTFSTRAEMAKRLLNDRPVLDRARARVEDDTRSSWLRPLDQDTRFTRSRVSTSIRCWSISRSAGFIPPGSTITLTCGWRQPPDVSSRDDNSDADERELLGGETVPSAVQV